MDSDTVALARHLAVPSSDPKYLGVMLTVARSLPPSIVTYTAWTLLRGQALHHQHGLLAKWAQEALTEILPLIPTDQVVDREFYSRMMWLWVVGSEPGGYAPEKMAELIRDIPEKLPAEWARMEASTAIVPEFSAWYLTTMAHRICHWIDRDAAYVPASLKIHFPEEWDGSVACPDS